jgi:hypothetical protein
VKPTPDVVAPGASAGASGSDIPNNELCVVCLNARRTHLLLHHNGSEGHLCCCAICANKLEEGRNFCPVCREPIREFVRCY